MRHDLQGGCIVLVSGEACDFRAIRVFEPAKVFVCGHGQLCRMPAEIGIVLSDVL